MGVQKPSYNLWLREWELEHQVIGRQGMPSIRAYKEAIKRPEAASDRLDKNELEKVVLGSLLSSWRYESADMRAEADKNKDPRTDYTSQSSVIKYAHCQGIDLTRRTLDRLENGDTRINKANAQKIRSLMNLPASYEPSSIRNIKSITNKYLKLQGSIILSMPDYFMDILVLFDVVYECYLDSLKLLSKYRSTEIKESDPASKKHEIEKIHSRFDEIRIVTELINSIVYKTAMKYIWNYNGKLIYEEFLNKTKGMSDHERATHDLMYKNTWCIDGVFTSAELDLSNDSLGDVSYSILVNFINSKGYASQNESILFFSLNLIQLFKELVDLFEDKKLTNNSDNYINNIKNIIMLDNYGDIEPGDHDNAKNVPWKFIREGMQVGVNILGISNEIKNVYSILEKLEKYNMYPNVFYMHLSETIKDIGLKEDINKKSTKYTYLYMYNREKHGNNLVNEVRYLEYFADRYFLCSLIRGLYSQGLVRVLKNEKTNFTYINIDPSLSDYVSVNENNIFFPKELRGISSCEYDLFMVNDDSIIFGGSRMYSEIEGGFFLSMACSKENIENITSHMGLGVGEYDKYGNIKLIQYGDVVKHEGSYFSENNKDGTELRDATLSGNVLKNILSVEIDCNGAYVDFNGKCYGKPETSNAAIDHAAITAAILSISFDDAARIIMSEFSDSDNYIEQVISD